MKNLRVFSEKVPIKNKKILLRLDLNVPIKNKKIVDDTRIKVVQPLIKSLIKKKAKVIIISHLGRPKGKKISRLTLKPIYDYFQKKLKFKIKFYRGKINHLTLSSAEKLKSGQILLLENIRFNKKEEHNDKNFAKKLANIGDIFINEAFSCSHRKQASVHMITKFVESYCGPLFKKEVDSISYLLKNKKRPVTCIIGGSKISTKINVLINLIRNSDNLIVVGAMANNFIKFDNFNTGLSLVENNTKKIIKKIKTFSKKNNCKVITPTDYLVGKTFNGKAIYRKIDSVENDEIILDVGKKSISKIFEIIKRSKTIFWNGPVGYYENINFMKGTKSLAKRISERTQKGSLISIVGGGDTIAAIKKAKVKSVFTHLSTAGGAFLESLEGKELPGIKVLKNNL
tara:strand:+ start:801 stop:1997 length:1197 start_codon:yes stop_codon:yes gene_type:complete